MRASSAFSFWPNFVIFSRVYGLGFREKLWNFFSSVNSTYFSISGSNFAKISILKKWKKKHCAYPPYPFSHTHHVSKIIIIFYSHLEGLSHHGTISRAILSSCRKKKLMLKFRALCGFMYGWVGNTMKLMGTLRTWWEQKVFDGLLVGTKRIWQEQFGNNGNLMGI